MLTNIKERLNECLNHWEHGYNLALDEADRYYKSNSNISADVSTAKQYLVVKYYKNLNLAKKYIDFLNGNKQEKIDIKDIEDFVVYSEKEIAKKMSSVIEKMIRNEKSKLNEIKKMIAVTKDKSELRKLLKQKEILESHLKRYEMSLLSYKAQLNGTAEYDSRDR